MAKTKNELKTKWLEGYNMNIEAAKNFILNAAVDEDKDEKFTLEDLESSIENLENEKD